MPRTAYAVIGANYGDEGKGLLVDSFARVLRSAGSTPVVVRSNGGAQAGHTVCSPSGRRHVFHHLGAGTLAGSPTFLSRFFVCNPSLFMQERRMLEDLPRVEVTIDPDCLVTTPWDMMVNQGIEDARSAGRHGSCGVGVFETLRRSRRDPNLRLTVQDLGSGMTTIEKCKRIRDSLFKRATLLSARLHDMFFDERLIDKWTLEAMAFLSYVKVQPGLMLHSTFADSPVIFEGAQGLALDQNNARDMPYLTPSNTGLQNIAALCIDFKIEKLNVVYVSRTYLTRHGAGPLPNEGVAMEARPSVDQTNVLHPYQGVLRHAPLSPLSMGGRITLDLVEHAAETGCEVNASLALTHMDELCCDPEKFCEGVSSAAGFDEVKYRSFGPTATDVRVI